MKAIPFIAVYVLIILLEVYAEAYTCKDEKFTSKSGTFSSPRHPRAYPDNAKCEYFIKAISGHYVEITFTKFKLEYKGDKEKTDFVQILDGRSKNRQQEVYYEGTLETPFKFISKTGRVTVNFVSNGDFGFSGFEAKYRMIPRTKCHQSKLEVEHGTVECNSDESGLAESCQVTCDDTYTLHGLAKVFCSNGEFAAPPTCEPDPAYHCDMRKLENLDATCTQDPETGRVNGCKVKCEHPYVLLGNETMTCDDSEWSQIPECTPDPDVLHVCEDNPDNSSCLFTREETEQFKEAFFEEMENITPLLTGKSVDGAMYRCSKKLCQIRRSTRKFYYQCEPLSRNLQKRYKFPDAERKRRMKHCFKCQSARCLHAIYIFS
ncbi:complement C1s subcomponent-like [Styela clava]